MKSIIYSAIITAATLGLGLSQAEAKEKSHGHDGHDQEHYSKKDYEKLQKHSHADRQRTIYVIERNRPVERLVFVDGNGSYYRIVSGQRIYIRDRYYTSYPSRYYYPDGRRRTSVTLSF